MRRHFFVFVSLLVIPALAGVQAEPPIAVITLEKAGEITLEFFLADAPKTVETFLKLTKQEFYDGTTFHRVERDSWCKAATRARRRCPPATGVSAPAALATPSRPSSTEGPLEMIRSLIADRILPSGVDRR